MSEDLLKRNPGVLAVQDSLLKGPFGDHVVQGAPRFRPIHYQHVDIGRKVQGHYAYYGITGNARALMSFRQEVTVTAGLGFRIAIERLR